MRLLMAIRSRDFSVETMYNSNSNKVDDIRITHNNMCIGNSNINRIVGVSSNPSINAVMRITSGCSWMPTNYI